MPRWLRILAQVGLTAGLLVALVTTVDGTAVYEALHRAQRSWLGVAVVLLPVNLALDGWVWARLLPPARGSLSARTVTRALFCGFALGFWTPVRLGEYAGRVLSVPDGDRWALSLSVLVQRVLDMAVGVGIGEAVLLGTLYAGLLPPSPAWLAVATLGGGTVLALTGAVLAPQWMLGWARRLPWGRAEASSRLAFLRRSTPRHLGPAFAGTVVRYFVFTGQFVCLALALAPSAAIPTLAAAAGLIFFAKYLLPSLTVLDLGVREGGAVFFFSLLGLDPAVGLGASLLLFTLNVLVPAALGLPTVWGLSVPGRSARDPESASVLPADF